MVDKVAGKVSREPDKEIVGVESVIWMLLIYIIKIPKGLNCSPGNNHVDPCFYIAENVGRSPLLLKGIGLSKARILKAEP